MFGYVITNCNALSDEAGIRFRALYCGMCDSLRRRYGQISRFTLSYDMTFLALVLTALYEPEEIEHNGNCLPHPKKKHLYVQSETVDYATDINILLAYYKCKDNAMDDHSLLASTEAVLLKKAFNHASKVHPVISTAIREWVDKTNKAEKSGTLSIDDGMNYTGEIMGRIFAWKNDFFRSDLYEMGENLGRFIYLMDAYEDLDKDIKKKRYNPLLPLRERADYDDFCHAALTMVIADCAGAFERLPIVKDADLIRNILYSGVWSKYNYIQQQKKQGEKEHENAGSL